MPLDADALIQLIERGIGAQLNTQSCLTTVQYTVWLERKVIDSDAYVIETGTPTARTLEVPDKYFAKDLIDMVSNALGKTQ